MKSMKIEYTNIYMARDKLLLKTNIDIRKNKLLNENMKKNMVNRLSKIQAQ